MCLAPLFLVFVRLFFLCFVFADVVLVYLVFKCFRCFRCLVFVFVVLRANCTLLLLARLLLTFRRFVLFLHVRFIVFTEVLFCQRLC